MEIKKTETEIYVAKDGKEFKDKAYCEEYEKNLKNLLEETLRDLELYDKSEDDVVFVGFDASGRYDDKERQYRISWEQFKQIAKNYWYDAGYGRQKVNEYLVIVGEDWWLERAEYDGSEWWNFKHKPNIDDYEFTEKIENIKL